MSLKIKLALFSFASLLCLGCEKGSKPLIFDESIRYFDKGFVSHFPESVPVSYSQNVISQNITKSHPYVWLKFNIDQVALDTLMPYYETKAKAIYNSEDSCLLVIDKHLTSKNWLDFDKTLYRPKEVDYGYQECMTDKFPVPNFFSQDWEEEPDSPTGLIGYKMYVIEAEKGLFLENTKLTNGLYTPPGWSHGITKGVAINGETRKVIYWADVW